MPRLGTLNTPNPYAFFGTFAGLPFWPGGLTLLAAAPGIGKTSWMLQINFDAAAHSIPSAMGCYEHTAEELRYRLGKQSQAAVAGPHDTTSSTDCRFIAGIHPYRHWLATYRWRSWYGSCNGN